MLSKNADFSHFTYVCRKTEKSKSKKIIQIFYFTNIMPSETDKLNTFSDARFCNSSTCLRASRTSLKYRINSQQIAPQKLKGQ